MEECWTYGHDVDDRIKDSVVVRKAHQICQFCRQTVENLYYQVKPDERTFPSQSDFQIFEVLSVLLGTMLTQNMKLGMKFPSPTVQCASRKIECTENNFVAQQFV